MGGVGVVVEARDGACGAHEDLGQAAVEDLFAECPIETRGRSVLRAAGRAYGQR